MDDRSKNWQPASSITDTNESLPSEKTEPWSNIHMTELWPEWQEQAACMDIGLESFFGTDSDIRPTMSTRQVRQAQAICHDCPVLGECLDWALSFREEYGVWGATSGRTRRRIWRWLRHGVVTQEQVVKDVENGHVRLYERDLDAEEEAV